jgi:hypothetical protein
VNRANSGLQRRGGGDNSPLVILGMVYMLITRIQVVRKAVHIRREPVESAVDIFAEVDTSGPQMWQQFLENRHLLFRKMATVVDHDVDLWDIPFEPLPEGPVCLVADEDFHGAVFVGFAGRFDVYAVNVARWSEIVPPHFQTSTAVNADLQEVNLSAPEFAEVPVIDLKIMIPFPNATPLSVGLEEPPQRIC